MPIFIRLSLLILIAVFSYPGHAQGLDVRTVLDTLIHSYGGESNLQKIDSVSLIEKGGLLALSLVENGVHVYYMVNKDKWLIEKIAGTIIMNGGEIGLQHAGVVR